jgi:hypothetical protein
MNVMKSLIPVFLFALLMAQPSLAQEAMSTDRPDFTESPLTVGQGTIQLEAGATIQTLGDRSEMSSGEGLIRYGLKPRFELRFGLPSLLSGDDIDSGLSDINVGFKWTIAQLQNGVDLGLVATAILPTGDEDFTEDAVSPSVIFIASKPVNDRMSIAGQFSVGLIEVGDEWDSTWLATVVAGASITDRLGGFLEVKGESTLLDESSMVFHAGLLFGVSEDFQLDFHLGTGLNETGGDEFFGLGLAVRR